LHLRLAGLALLAALFAVIVSAAEEKKANAQPKIKVILIDGQNNHNWRATSPLLKKILEDSGRFTVDVSTNLKKDDKPGEIKDTVPFPPNLSTYDVVLSNYNGQPWPKEFESALDSQLKKGKLALVIVHAANNSFQGWPEYNQMIGLGWRGNNFGERIVTDDKGSIQRVEKGKGPGASHGPQHAFKVIIRDPEHPITKGMPLEWLHAQDELYHGLRGPAQNMKLLATAYSDKDKYKGTGEHEPMIWTVSYGEGRVFHTPMGHDLNGMRCYGFVGTLLRGTEWAATGKVTIPLPKEFPTADKVSQMPVK
jgi:type 1 glutamine amidotransferase